MKLWKAMSVLGFAAAAAMAHSARAADSAKITYAAFDTAVEVPGGKLLPPGEYAFKIVRETSSSEVVQIFLALQAGTLGTPSPFNANHPMTLSATVLAVTDYRSRPGRGTVSYWQSRGGGPRALRTVLFAMDPQPLVFVYPRARAAELAKAGHLIRLWRPPLGPGEWRSIGLFRAVDEAELGGVLASLPLHIWMKVTITPLSPHPNDPEFRAHQTMDHPPA